LDDILTDVGGVDLVKFDVERVEYEVFSAARHVCDVRVVVGEIKRRKT